MRRKRGDPHDDLTPLSQLRRPASGPVPSLGHIREGEPWVWIYCANAGCNYYRPIALAPYIIRWGADASIDLLRQRVRCSKCGRMGATIKKRSWDAHRQEWQQWPQSSSQDC